LRRLQELAVERVGPAVIAALQNGAFPLPFRHRAGAVAADVGQRAQRAVVAADDEQRLAGQRGGEEVAHGAHLVGAPDELPRPREDVPLLAAQDRRIDVEARRKCRGALQPGLKAIVVHVVGGWLPAVGRLTSRYTGMVSARTISA